LFLAIYPFLSRLRQVISDSSYFSCSLNLNIPYPTKCFWHIGVAL
jgi:hypothetical protein